VDASAFTQSVELFEINLLSLVGLPSEIASGGIKLKVKGELRATYWTEQINLTAVKPKEQVLPIAPIKQENGSSQHGYKEGAYVEYDVNPDGMVHYDGVIHLIPVFYVSVLGQDFDMPVYDYPITIPIGDQDFNFDKIRVHVPLPDVPPLAQKVYDFGKVDMGSSKKMNISVANIGEAKARAVPEVEKSMATVFKVLTNSVTMDPNKSEDIQIRFAPKKMGPFSTTLTLASNDPDSPLQHVELKGEAVEPGTAPVTPDTEDGGGQQPLVDGGGFQPDDGGPGFYNEQQDSGCGCVVAGASDSKNLAMWTGLGLVAAAAVARKRRKRD
jgi:MYXO-CTERM domain-containing protein